ncbi:MAG: AarF/ABC1/UbiB kinase family protein, partial [Aquihabitans sp.]
MLDTPAADTVFGAFTAHGPWVLDPEAITWMPGLDRLRADVQAEIPDLTRRRWLPPGRRLLTTVRYLGVAVGAWVLTERRVGGSTKISGISRRLREAAEELGPTYIKLG